MTFIEIIVEVECVDIKILSYRLMELKIVKFIDIFKTDFIVLLFVES